MHLNSILQWILAAARAAGERRSPLGGDVARVGSEVASGVQPRAEGAGPKIAETGRRTGAVSGPRVEGLQGQVQVAGACLGEQTKGASNGSEAKPQPQEAVKVGGGPSGEGWKVEAQLTKEERSYEAAVVERNRDVFAFSLEEIGEFKPFEVELNSNQSSPSLRGGADTASGSGSLLMSVARSWRRRGL